MWFKRLLMLLTIACFGLGLSGCMFIYKPDIKQGNIITLDKVKAIHVGMSHAQVIGILGYPVLVNLFEDQQSIYVYTLQPGHGEFQQKHLRIFFDHDHVTHYTTNVTKT